MDTVFPTKGTKIVSLRCISLPHNILKCFCGRSSAPDSRGGNSRRFPDLRARLGSHFLAKRGREDNKMNVDGVKGG